MTTQEVEEYRHAVQGTLDIFGSVLRDIRDRVLVLSRVAVEAIERAERAERVAEEAKAEANRLAAEAASSVIS